MARILVVDDDEAQRAFLEGRLREAGHQTFTAGDGQAALGAVRDHAPELVLMDVEMPGLGGREACRILKAQTAAFGFIPVILMTAHTDLGTLVEGVELGADDFLFKPVQPLELQARVLSMLRLKGLQDGLLAANHKLKGMNDRLQELSTTDQLMGIYNRLYFQKRLAYEFQRAMRYRKALSLLELDLDHFKAVNDVYGHPAGDAVLRSTAGVILQAVRELDLVARLGGEEIAVALPETGLPEARVVAERIRAQVQANRVEDGGKILQVTLSIGLATAPDARVASEEDLFRLADEALYAAKRAGRNCVRSADEDDPMRTIELPAVRKPTGKR